MKNQNQTLFSANLGRFNILTVVRDQLIQRLLRQKSRKHIDSGKHQIAVFAFDHIGNIITTEGGYEFRELDVLFDWLRRSDTSIFQKSAIDIGANIGNHSLYFSRLFPQIYSFEPNPRTYQLLKFNSTLTDNIFCFDVAVSDTNSEGTLNVNPENLGNTSVSTDGSGPKILLRRLDSVLEPGEQIGLIKVDVEGHELQALLGSSHFIQSCQPLIIFEQQQHDFVNGRSPTIEFLKRSGYSKFATLRNYPRAPNHYNKALRALYTLFGKLALGDSIKIVLQKEFEAGYYSFIIALPDWFSIPATTSRI